MEATLRGLRDFEKAARSEPQKTFRFVCGQIFDPTGRRRH
jgi:hypothetical protein